MKNQGPLVIAGLAAAALFYFFTKNKAAAASAPKPLAPTTGGGLQGGASFIPTTGMTTAGQQSLTDALAKSGLSIGQQLLNSLLGMNNPIAGKSQSMPFGGGAGGGGLGSKKTNPAGSQTGDRSLPGGGGYYPPSTPLDQYVTGSYQGDVRAGYLTGDPLTDYLLTGNPDLAATYDQAMADVNALDVSQLNQDAADFNAWADSYNNSQNDFGASVDYGGELSSGFGSTDFGGSGDYGGELTTGG